MAKTTAGRCRRATSARPAMPDNTRCTISCTLGWRTETTIPPTIAGWAKAVGCPSTSQAGFSQGDVVETYYAPCGTGADTQLYTVTDGGHQWPGGLTIPGLGFDTKVIDASALIAQFFIAHPLH